MDTPMLHLVGPGRDGTPAMVAGNVEALRQLRKAIDTAIATGVARTELFCSDGEPYELLIAAPPSMRNVYTAYVGEVRPVRSKRELLPLEELCGLLLPSGQPLQQR